MYNNKIIQNPYINNYLNKNINVCEELDNYEEQSIYFCEPIKNNIINNGNFIRILYSRSFVLLNGIYLYFSLNIHSVEKYYNKFKYNFHINQYVDIIEKCKSIEEELLKKIELNKIPQYKLSEQFNNGNIKIFNNTNSKCINTNEWIGINNFILKISGIWENELYYGLTFKFIKANHI